MDSHDKRAMLAERERTLKKATDVAYSVAKRSLGPILTRLQALEKLAAKPGPAGSKGEDGLAFDNLNCLMTGERTLAVIFENGQRSKKFEFDLPVPIFRGAYKEGQVYARGDLITHAGSLWHVNELTTEKPGARSKAYTLCVRRGRDGRDGKDGKQGDKGITGRRGRDATQLHTDGRKT